MSGMNFLSMLWAQSSVPDCGNVKCWSSPGLDSYSQPLFKVKSFLESLKKSSFTDAEVLSVGSGVVTFNNPSWLGDEKQENKQSLKKSQQESLKHLQIPSFRLIDLSASFQTQTGRQLPAAWSSLESAALWGAARPGARPGTRPGTETLSHFSPELFTVYKITRHNYGFLMV